ncbi:hypothetical protein [uncultured Friedmanniella sp.]|uniref:hypothetical protein n=1 Tax=uncultured Friedmanniella sp. TaxID=335381 RepID=UPI0035CC89E9
MPTLRDLPLTARTYAIAGIILMFLAAGCGALAWSHFHEKNLVRGVLWLLLAPLCVVVGGVNLGRARRTLLDQRNDR